MAKSTKSADGGGWTPILLVHGITSSAKFWTKPQIGTSNGGPSIVDAIANVPGAAVYGFDYSKNSLDWVTSPAIAPELADSIACLENASGHQVIVVAHSMGGLATQQAQASLQSNELAEVITIGTPTEGSGVLAAAKAQSVGLVISPGLAEFTDLLVEFCGISGTATPSDGLCSVVSSKDTEAGRAMVPGSAQLSALPAWKTGITVARATGDMTVELQIGTAHKTFDVGDGVVSTDSATASANGPTYVDKCGPISAWHSAKPLTKVMASECYHGNEPRNPAIVAWVVHQIAKTAKAPRTYKAPLQIDGLTGNGASNDGLTPLLWGDPVNKATAVTGLTNPQYICGGTSYAVLDDVPHGIELRFFKGVFDAYTLKKPGISTSEGVQVGATEQQLTGAIQNLIHGPTFGRSTSYSRVVNDHLQEYLVENGIVTEIAATHYNYGSGLDC